MGRLRKRLVTGIAAGYGMLVTAFLCSAGATAAEPVRGQVYVVPPGDDVQFRLQERLIEAVPGDVIQLEAGRYQLQGQLDVVANNLTIRGRGSDKTILSFKGQTSGGQGIEATGNNFVIEGLAVEDTAGNAIKVLGARNVIFRDVRAEWTGPPSASNGAYGLYPVQCHNVLMENCSSFGASDAGLYVGQCHNVVVRACRAERNVAGIEIENTVHADVYENIATNNSGGILVFDLPGLQVKSGRDVRVFRNKIIKNNHPNFATPGSTVATVPPGTGAMVLATDRVEVFENQIEGNQTASLLVISYLALNTRINDETYDPIPEFISIHNNQIVDGGTQPQGALVEVLKPVFGERFPDMLWDGVVNPATGQTTLNIADNGSASFANFRLPELNEENLRSGKYSPQTDATGLVAKFDRWSGVELPAHDAPEPQASAAVTVYRSLPRKLSEFGLFQGELRRQEPAEGVVLYDLNAALFSDYTTKRRFIQLPAGKTIEYQELGVLKFPVGTVIAKTFSYPHDMRDPAKGERILETRIEVLKDTGWYGASYIWDGDQTDATLAIGGSETDVSWVHADGQTQKIRYQIPNANQCLTCHNQEKAFVPIGPTARNMNRSFPRGGKSGNQLQYLAESGLLHGMPSASQVSRWPSPDDSRSGTVAERARAWLDVNCAHCHSPLGTARTSGLDLRWDQADLGKVGFWKSPVAAGPGSGGRQYDIVPGKPDESIIMFRLESEDPSVMMPNLGRRLVHHEGVDLVRQWIESLPPDSK